MFEKSWRYRICCSNGEDPEQIAQKLNIPTYIVDILNKRGLCDYDELSAFLNPEIERLCDPMTLKDIEPAIERILQAAEDGEKVTIFGDYDADGITSTAVLYHFLKNQLDMDVDFYIPDRLSEGYGMSKEAVEYIANQGTTLIITVDCGIMCHEEIDYAFNLGVEVIVTDHHKCGEILPRCVAVVNPTRPDCEYPYKTLAGVGVVFRVISAIGLSIGIFDEVYEYLPLVAVGTIGDSMPLTGDNRIIVKKGLAGIKNSAWTGLTKLIELSNGKGNDNITSTYIAFNVVPKINAAGRMGEAQRALYLLLTEDEEVAFEYASELTAENIRRQEIEAETVKEALMHEYLKTTDADSVIVTVGDSWHHGVIGIVAAKLTEKFNKPSIVLTYEEGSDKDIRGSARSVEGFNIHKALTNASEYLTKFGGHSMAAGLTMEADKMPFLIEELNKYAKNEAFKEVQIPYYDVDGILEHEYITIEGAKSLRVLEPFGQGNEPPLFCSNDLRVKSCVKIGNNKHLRINFLTKEGRELQGVAFNKGTYCSMISKLDKVAVLFRLEVNSYRDTENVSLNVEDILDSEFIVDNLTNNMYNSEYLPCRSFSICRKDMLLFYKLIKTRYNNGFTFADLENMRQILLPEGINWFKLRKALDIFIELGIIVRSGKGIYTLNFETEKVELESSSIYKGLNNSI